MTYYAIRWTIKSGTITPVTKKGTKEDMERQFYLFCASAATNADENEFDCAEWGTLEGGKLDRRVWDRR